MDLTEFFQRVEETHLARFREAEVVQHHGDRGLNREGVLRKYLADNLPKRYGVEKGEIVTREGQHSHSADLIIYDALNGPVLYSNETAVLPVESVYGIIEVKSRLTKAELVDAAMKIEAFKRLAPRELNVIQTREYVTVHRPSRPFGIILGYELGDNSLASLLANWKQENSRIHEVNYFTNLVTVLGEGLLHFELVNFENGTKEPFLDTDQFVQHVLTVQKRARNHEATPNVIYREVLDAARQRTFGRMFTYLLMMLARMKLGSPDLGRYIDPTLPVMITRES